ncbi:MAG: DUF4831 family protein [Candidatus Limimorpha sp.]
MKKNHLIVSFLISVLFVCSIGVMRAQFVTTFAKNVTPGQQKGIYYSLPQTVLQLDFLIEESEVFKGPFSDYALRLLGTSDYIQADGMEYRMVGLSVSTKADVDPNATFFVSIPSRSSNPVTFNLLPNGIIKSLNVGKEETEQVSGNTSNQETPRHVAVSTSDNVFGNLLISSEPKSSEAMAKSIVAKIEKIREEKFNLLKGYQETAYDSKTLEEMYARLEAMENDYLSLFIGKRIPKTVTKTIHVIPSKDIPTMTVGKFSETKGLTTGTMGAGFPITVQIISLQNTAVINAPSESAIALMTHENNLIYRIPDMANVKVSCGNRVLLEDRFPINQLGVMLMAPVGKNSLYFDTQTGQVTNLRIN